ncbi:uncharacterized protein LOC120114449 [Hibiscus syriacus]|uniref:uncharacterized protein LOC120114449 n=1 Tax=Hibiscus syriacus TaxID=106335 RepID=UPI001923B4BC|nr:uncharacterized protein LOC120114449 [Hibiscus syriacus]
MDWRKLFGSSTSNNLNFFPSKINDGIPMIIPPAEILEAGSAEWKLSLVGQFLGPTPNFTTMQRIVNSLWTKALQGSRVQVSLAGPNLYIFSFDSEAAREWVLENLWHILNKTLILRKWEPSLKRLDFDLSKISIWIHIYNVPLELFNQVGLSYIASGIGILISMDYVTALRTRLQFAKVCVEIDVNDEIPKQVEVVLQNGQSTSVFIEIPWLPPRCRKCKVFGHNDKNCLVKHSVIPASNQVWKIKESSNANSSHGEVVLPLIPSTSDTSPKDFPPSVSISAESSNPEQPVVPVLSDLPSTDPFDMNLESVSATHICQNKYDLQANPTIEIQHSSDHSSYPENSSAVPKRDRERPSKEKVDCAGSSNRFKLLSSIEEVPLVKMSLKGKLELLQKEWLNLGFNHPLKQDKVLLRASQNNVDILCLLETRVKVDKSKDIFHSKLINWNVSSNYDFANNRRIWILWKKNIDLSTIQVSDQIISVKGQFLGQSFVLSAVYGSNDNITRRQLWQHIQDLERTIGHLPWILGGDFNIILQPNESSNHELLCPFSTTEMKDFQDLSQDLDLHDHPFIGPLLTWSNKQTENYLDKKLDRVLINSNWVNNFQNPFVEFLPPGVSDHCMASVRFSKDNPINKPKPFKFFYFWTSHPNYLTEIENSWQTLFQGNPMQILFHKLKHLKSSLKNLNSSCFSDISSRIKLKRLELENQQLLSLKGENLIEKELQIQHELRNLEEAELTFLKQKAKGNRLESFDTMSSEVLYFFTKLLEAADLKVNVPGPQFFTDFLKCTLPSTISSCLTKDITSQEIKEAFFGQGNDKAPGPDGYTPLFFKSAWHIIGEDIVAAIKYFFHHTFLLPAFNATTLALIPKIPNPCKVKDFRSIACCTVIYKAITKILVQRLSCFIPDLISLNQTVFIKGMSIVDNTLFAQELVRGYGRKAISPRCSMKIDLQKAFDTLHWGFLSYVLRALNIPIKFINWVEACFTEARFSISFNGTLIGYFKGARGIRQGDPLSPILYVISMNVLSRILNLAAEKGLFSFHPKCKIIGLTHLSFADDLLIFCKGNVDSVIGVISVLDQFYGVYGLNLNASKCSFFCAGISPNNIDHIKKAIGFQHGLLSVKYLGRLELIRAVLFSIANYWCRQLMLPYSIISKIEQLCSRFFWKGSDKSASGEGSLWVAWIHTYVLKESNFRLMDDYANIS